MHKLHTLKENLIHKLGEYADAEITGSNINAIDTLAHAAKNVGKIIKMCEEEDERGYSYARKRDAMGRYSRDGGKFLDRLREMSDEAPDERTREEIHRLIDKMEIR